METLQVRDRQGMSRYAHQTDTLKCQVDRVGSQLLGDESALQGRAQPADVFHAAGQTVRKIVNNVATAPTETKYRKVNLANPKIEELLVRGGGVAPLLDLGWVEVRLRSSSLAWPGFGVALPL